MKVRGFPDQTWGPKPTSSTVASKLWLWLFSAKPKACASSPSLVSWQLCSVQLLGLQPHSSLEAGESSGV